MPARPHPLRLVPPVRVPEPDAAEVLYELLEETTIRRVLRASRVRPGRSSGFVEAVRDGENALVAAIRGAR